LLRNTLIVIALFSLTASVAPARASSEADGQDRLQALQDSLFTDQEDADLNGDGIVDFLDLGLLRSQLLLSGALSDNSLHAPLALVPGSNVLFFTLPGQFTPLSQVSVVAQESLFLDLHMSFTDSMIGGGIDLVFEPGVLSFIDGVFDDGLGDEPNFRCPTDPTAPAPIDCLPKGPNFVSWAVGGPEFTPITGDHLVVSLEFAAIATGSSPIEFTVTSPFSDPSGQPLTVVPEPHFAGLAALATLGALKMRRRRGHSSLI
jgi:hypothetical protein